MRRLLLPLATAVLSLSLMVTTLLPVTQVSAQRFGTSTEVIESETGLYQQIITEDRVQNPSFMQAFEDYKTAVGLFTPHDVYFEESVGSSLTEVQDTFVAAVEGEFFTLIIAALEPQQGGL